MLGERGLEVYRVAAGDGRCRDLNSRVVFRYLGVMRGGWIRLNRKSKRCRC